MRSIVKKSVMLAGAFLLFAGANANAAEGSVLLLRGEKGNHAVTFLRTTRASRQDPAGTPPALTFTHNENQYRLSSVWESGSEGWSVINR